MFLFSRGSYSRMTALVLVVPTLLVVARVNLAQTPDPVIMAQVPIPGSGHHYIGMAGETVNPADGSLAFTLPIEPPAGRQLSMPFGITYSSSEQYYLQAGNDSHVRWTRNLATRTPFQVDGWSYDLPRITAQAATRAFELGEPPRWPPNTQLYCDYIQSSVFRGFDGVWRQLGYQGQWPNGTYPSSCTWTSYPTSYGSSSTHGWAAITPTPYTPRASQPALDITDPSGTTYHFPEGVFVAPGPGSLPVIWGLLAQYVTDKNGNRISLRDSEVDPVTGAVSYAGNAYIDTLGRQLVSWPGIGHDGDQLSIAGLSGNIVLRWASKPISFPESGSMAYGSATCTLTANETPSNQLQAVTEIDLPNGQKYMFSYDSTYGRVSRITFPGGGYVRYVWGLNRSSAVTQQFWSPQGVGQEHCYLVFDTPAIVDRYVSYDGTTEVFHQHFDYPATTWITPTPTNDYWWTAKNTTVTSTDLVTNQVTVTLYRYLPFPAETNAPSAANSSWLVLHSSAPVEQTVTYQDGTGHTLKTVNKTWLNPFAMIGEQTVLDNGQGTAIQRCYDAHEQVTNAYRYAFQSEGSKPADPELPPGSAHGIIRHSIRLKA